MKQSYLKHILSAIFAMTLFAASATAQSSVLDRDIYDAQRAKYLATLSSPDNKELDEITDIVCNVLDAFTGYLYEIKEDINTMVQEKGDDVSMDDISGLIEQKIQQFDDRFPESIKLLSNLKNYNLDDSRISKITHYYINFYNAVKELQEYNYELSSQLSPATQSDYASSIEGEKVVEQVDDAKFINDDYVISETKNEVYVIDASDLPASTQSGYPADHVFEIVDQMPQFPGGSDALLSHLASHIIYPEEAVADYAQGRVIVRFVVKADGSIGEVKILRGCHPALDKEAVRAVKSLPNFIPGKVNNNPVNVYFTLPINFKFSDPEPDPDAAPLATPY